TGPDLAEPFLRDGLRAAQEVGGPRFAAPPLEFTAEAAAGVGDLERAARLAGAAAGLYERLGRRSDRVTPIRAPTVAVLRPLATARATRRAYQEGLGLSLEAAVALALGDDAPADTAAFRAARLTRRQLDIVRLIATGGTNRDVAAELGISERTVEGHLEQVRNRLGFSSRVRIAAWWIEHGGGAGSPAGPIRE
ncbi:MAG: helix-turn-helix transcriptional regulator, partial [Candidatus Dormibacteraeota bacterium]|nr:helix-turn-helix transcriptional regulator [Candidatus Dormibacteraeota bacterium]